MPIFKKPEESVEHSLLLHKFVDSECYQSGGTGGFTQLNLDSIYLQSSNQTIVLTFWWAILRARNEFVLRGASWIPKSDFHHVPGQQNGFSQS